MVEPAQIEEWNRTVAGAHPRDVLQFAYSMFSPNITLASSFGMEDVLLIHYAAQVADRPDVFCLNTDLLFPETMALIESIQSRYALTYRDIRPKLTLAEQSAQHGEKLWENNPDACCGIRKVEPLARALGGYTAWITGIRRDQTPNRANAQWIEWDPKFNLIKVNPLVTWTADEVRHVVQSLDIPYNPLHDQGYPSIGCWPCTRPVKAGEDPRAGRWAQFDKTECGLHL